MKYFFIIVTALISLASYGQDCNEQYRQIQQEFNTRYQPEYFKNIVKRVQSTATAEELKEFTDLSLKFRSIPHDSEDHMKDRYALQKRARIIVRAVVSRAGYRILNPVEPSPYDAVIGGKNSSDGNPEYLIEVRSLLVMNDPRPHVTLWLQREGKNYNPWSVVTVGFTASADQDYISWRPNGTRISTTIEEFLKRQLPTSCR